VTPPTRLVVAVSRRMTSDSVMAPLPASAALAFSNSWLFCRIYVIKAVERNAPMRIISLSVSPAAASVDAPPIRNEWVDMRVWQLHVGSARPLFGIWRYLVV
jgi:hypothetical protein